MSEEKFTTEMTLKVFHNDFGYAVVVGEDSDGLGMVSMYYSEDGVKVDDRRQTLTFDPLMALKVADAIKKQAAYILDRDRNG